MDFNLFKNLRRKSELQRQVNRYFKLMTAYSPVFTTFEGGVYEMALTRRAIDCIATHCSKMLPEVQGQNNSTLIRTLQTKPNPNMNTAQYLYKLATYFETDNTAFILPIYDSSYERPVGFYPVRSSMVEYLQNNYGEYFKFSSSGITITLPKDEVGVINKFTLHHDFFGESNQVLEPTLDLINVSNQGIIEGVKKSASIRFLARLASKLSPEDEDEARKSLTEMNLSTDNNGGAFVYGPDFEDVKEINSEPFTVNADQQKLIEDNVFTYFGVNKNILQNKFTPDEWSAFYEGKLEPFAIQLSLTHTNMKFTEREIGYGNSIIFTTNRLQYETTETKLAVTTALFDRGMATQNMCCDVFQLPHIPNGDRYFIRKEYLDMANVTDDMAAATAEGENNENNS